MGTFSSFGLNQAYHERYEKLGDRLSDVGKTLDWDVFRPLLESMYANKKCKGYSATMKRGARGHPIGIRDKLRNLRISKKRSKGERPYAVIKNVFHAGLVKVTTLQRVRVKNMLAAFCYNIYQVKTIQNRV